MKIIILNHKNHTLDLRDKDNRNTNTTVEYLKTLGYNLKDIEYMTVDNVFITNPDKVKTFEV